MSRHAEFSTSGRRGGWGLAGAVGVILLVGAGCFERAKPELRSGAGPWGGQTIVSHVSRTPGTPGSAYRVQPPGTPSGHQLPPELTGGTGGTGTPPPIVVVTTGPEPVDVPPPDNPPPDVAPATETIECACNATTACDYDCACDADCPCACDAEWSCEFGCACDPECEPTYGDCLPDGTCNARCPGDPDCSEPAVAEVEECACDETWACDYECECDPECPCPCDLAWSCEGDCGCDPECRPEHGDCAIDGTCNARCPSDPDCEAEAMPPVVASADLEQYRQRCVDGINAYRATLGLPALGRWTQAEGCVDGESRSDGVSGIAHGSFGACGERAQNACPGYPSVESTVGLCLQQMWDEGPGEPFSAHGHFLNMSSESFREVACGFFEAPNGDVWAIQDFR